MKQSQNLSLQSASVCACLLVSAAVLSSQGARGMPDGFKLTPRDLSKELANKTTGTYTVTAVGDVLMQEPMSTMMSPDLLEVLPQARTRPSATWRCTWSTDGTGVSVSETTGRRRRWRKTMPTWASTCSCLVKAPAVKPGMRSSMKYLDEVGIGLAGYGANAAIARTAVLQHTKKGRIALHAAYPVTGNADWAQGTLGSDGYGLNPMRLTAWNVVTKDQLEQLKAIRDDVAKTRGEPCQRSARPRDPIGPRLHRRPEDW